MKKFFSLKTGLSLSCYLVLMLSAMAAGNVSIIADEELTIAISGRTATSLTLSEDSFLNFYVGEYNYGDSESFTAPTKSGYRFDAWYTLAQGDDDTRAASGTKPSLCTVQLTSSSTITASQVDAAKRSKYFDRGTDPDGNRVICPKYVKTCEVTATVNPSGAGSVAGAGTYDTGSAVKLTANPAEGYQFVRWQDGVKDNPRTITLSSDVTYTASFEAKGYGVSTTETNCKITVGDTVVYDQDLSIKWEPVSVDGYTYSFKSVKVMSGSDTLKTFSSGTSGSFNMKSDKGRFYSSVTIVGEYAKSPIDCPLTLDVTSIGISNVCYRLDGESEWRETVTNATVMVPFGTVCHAYANAYEGYVPNYTASHEWSETMKVGGLTFTPTAGLDGFTLTVNPDEGWYKGSQEAYTFPDIRLRPGMTNLNFIGTATNYGKRLVGFRDGRGQPVYDKEGRNVKGDYWTEDYPNGVFQGKSDLTVKAVWGEPIPQYVIATDSDPSAGGNVDGAGTYDKDTQTELRATANEGYSFARWMQGDEEVSTDNPLAITVTANATYVAVFTGNVYKVMFFDENGGIFSPTWKPVTFGKPYGDLPRPTYEDPTLSFTCWMDSESGGNVVTKDTTVTAAGSHFLYAAPPEKRTSFDVVFEDAKGGNSSVTNPDVAVGTEINEAYAASSTASWKNPNGWTLVGWQPSLPQTVTFDLTLTAQWISISEVLDCPDLTFNTDYGSEWVPTEDGFAHHGGSCMRMDESNGEDVLFTKIDTAGMLHFHWKGGVGCKLTVKINKEQDQRIYTAVADMPWTQVDIEIKEPCQVEFACTEQNFKEFCALDHVIWEPGAKPKKAVTFHDPSGTFKDDVVREVKDGSSAEAPAWSSDKFDPKDCAWDADFSNVTSNFTVNAVWSCRVVFEDPEGGNPSTTNRVPRGATEVEVPQMTRSGYTWTGWMPPLAYPIVSNVTLTAVWTENAKHSVTYLPGQGVTGSLATQTEYRDVPITLGDNGHFFRSGYLQIGWATVEGGEKAFDFGEAYAGDSITLYPAWEKDVNDVSRALDCDNLTFEAEGGWEIYTDAAAGVEFAKKGGSCMRTETKDSKIMATVTTPGTLTFWWKGKGTQVIVWISLNDVEQKDKRIQIVNESSDKDWQQSSLDITATKDSPVTVEFKCNKCLEGYCALDAVTWVPEQTHPEPGPGDEVEISSVSVSDGKFTLSFQSDDRFDYNLLTNANLLIDSWGVWGVKPGDGKTLLFEPPILPGEPRMFYKVETIQRKE